MSRPMLCSERDELVRSGDLTPALAAYEQLSPVPSLAEAGESR